MSLSAVKVEVAIVLGSSVITMQQLLGCGRGAVIELDSKQDDPVLVLANNRPVAKGEIVLDGNKISISILDLLPAA